MHITIITGEIDSGKTTYLSHMIEKIDSRERIAGIIAHGLYEPGKTRKSGFSIESLATGEERMLLYSTQGERTLAVGRFFMSQENLLWAIDELYASKEATAIVIDELGPLELQRRGYYDVVNWILRSWDGRELFLVIRTELLDKILDIFHLDAYKYTIVYINKNKRTIT